MKQNDFLSTSELAKILGISRIAVFKKIKKGEIKAVKIGRNFVIKKNDLSSTLKSRLNKKSKKEIDEALEKLIEEHGETLKKLGE